MTWHPLTQGLRGLLVTSALLCVAIPAAAWSDAGAGYCPTATMRPRPGTIPADLPHLVTDGWLGGVTIEIVRVHDDGMIEPMIVDVAPGPRSLESHITIEGGWVEGARYRVSAPGTACTNGDDVEYVVGPALGSPASLGTVRVSEVRATPGGGGVADVWLELAPEARPFVDVWDVQLSIDGVARDVGALADPTETLLTVRCGDSGGLAAPGPAELAFAAGPPGADTVVTTATLSVTLTCPPSGPPPSSGDPDAGIDEPADAGPGGGAGAPDCSVGAPGASRSGAWLLALALGGLLRRRSRSR